MTSIIAHRGASVAEPENTIAAFERAVAFGADGIELDVRRTADDRLVVHHDAILPDGRTIRSTLARDLPSHVPTLDAALDACGDLVVHVEIKSADADPDRGPDSSEWIAHRVIADLARRRTPWRWMLSSFRFRTVECCASLAPELPVAWCVGKLTPARIERAARSVPRAVNPAVRALDEGSVRAAHRAGLAVHPWSTEDPELIAELIAWGIDGIYTDAPDVALSVRRSIARR